MPGMDLGPGDRATWAKSLPLWDLQCSEGDKK